MGKFFTILGAEILLFAVPLMIDPAWTYQQLPALILVGFILLAGGLMWDHLPRSITFLSSYFWLDVDRSARLFRDYLRSQPTDMALKEFDRMASDLEDDGIMLSPTTRAFHFWMVMGLSEGKLECYGVSKHGSKYEKIKGKPSEGIDQYHLVNKDPTSVLMKNGETFSKITIRRSSLKAFADYLGGRYAEPQESPKEGQN